MGNLLYAIAVILIHSMADRISSISCRKYYSCSTCNSNYCCLSKGYSGEKALKSPDGKHFTSGNINKK